MCTLWNNFCIKSAPVMPLQAAYIYWILVLEQNMYGYGFFLCLIFPTYPSTQKMHRFILTLKDMSDSRETNSFIEI